MKRRLSSMAVLLACACSPAPPKAQKAAAPAHVAGGVKKEEDLASVTLTPEAESRLAVRTSVVEEKQLPALRRVGGEVAVPAGRALVVTAPLAGTLLAPADAPVPAAGAAVGKGQVVFRLRPLPGATDLGAAEARLEAARAKARRVEQLLEAGAASVRAVEEARAELAAAEAGGRSLAPSSDTGSGAVLVLSSPQDGLLHAVRAAPGQSVAASAPLFDVVSRDPLWVRVPLYVGDLAGVDEAKGARVHDLSENAGAPGRPARLISGPPSADAQAATADLYFEVANSDGRLRPGQRVSVSLALKTEDRGRVVPWSAILYDFQGGTWVYENTAPQVFVRRRVEVSRVVGDSAVLARGPAVGAKIVTTGAAELFGTELGSGK
jgi:RND family efflux transporter MFP subunit